MIFASTGKLCLGIIRGVKARRVLFVPYGPYEQMTPTPRDIYQTHPIRSSQKNYNRNRWRKMEKVLPLLTGDRAMIVTLINNHR